MQKDPPHQRKTHHKNAHRATALHNANPKRKRSLISTRESCPGQQLACWCTMQTRLHLDNVTEHEHVWVSGGLVSSPHICVVSILLQLSSFQSQGLQLSASHEFSISSIQLLLNPHEFSDIQVDLGGWAAKHSTADLSIV